MHGGISPSNQQISQEIQDVIDQNATDVRTNWTGFYLDGAGVKIPNGAGGYYTTADAGSPPGPPGPYTACGVEVSLTPNWQPYFAQVIGPGTQQTQANARSVYKASHGIGAGIVALDEVSPHQVLGGGHGSFNVYGTIFANSTVPYDPWGANHNGKRYVDVVDAKGDSNLTLHGDMQTVGSNWPLDWCFGVDASSPPNDSGTLYNGPKPNQPICNGGSGTNNLKPLIYDNIVPNSALLADPLGTGGGGSGLADPFDKTGGTGGFTQGLCLGQAQPPSISVLPLGPGFQDHDAAAR